MLAVLEAQLRSRLFPTFLSALISLDAGGGEAAVGGAPEEHSKAPGLDEDQRRLRSNRVGQTVNSMLEQSNKRSNSATALLIGRRGAAFTFIPAGSCCAGGVRANVRTAGPELLRWRSAELRQCLQRLLRQRVTQSLLFARFH